MHVVGRKGIGYFKYVGQAMATQRTDITDRPRSEDAASLVDALMADFQAGTLDAVYVVSARFKSAISTPPTTERLLPVEPPKRSGPLPDYLLYPSADAILTELLPSYVGTQCTALVETAAGEQGARARQ